MKAVQGWARACLVVLFVCVMIAPSWGSPSWDSDATPEEGYKKPIHVSQDIQPLGEHPFGEHIGLYNGALPFQQTDVSESGNGPVLQFVRRFDVQGVALTLLTRGQCCSIKGTLFRRSLKQ